MPLISKSNRPYNTPREDDLIKLQQKIGGKEIRFSTDLKLELPQEVTTNEDFINFTKDINLFGIFKDLKPYGENLVFPCIFTEGNVAWIEQDIKGTYRYFTKTKKAQNAIGYTVVDILRALDEEDVTSKRSFLLARRELAFLTQAKYDDFIWEYKQLCKYCINIRQLEVFYERNKNNKNMKNYFSILHLFNEAGIHYLSTKGNSINDEAVFFIPLSDVVEETNLEPSIVSKLIKQLENRGFINKIKTNHKQYPTFFQEKINESANFSHSIPSYTEELFRQLEIPF